MGAINVYAIVGKEGAAGGAAETCTCIEVSVDTSCNCRVAKIGSTNRYAGSSLSYRV